MEKVKQLFGACLVAVTLLFAGTAQALDLQSAKAGGLVGEMSTGYIGQVSGGSDVAALVADINQRRRQAYQAIAKKNNASLASVEQLAAKKTLAKTPPGQFINNGSGWRKK